MKVFRYNGKQMFMLIFPSVVVIALTYTPTTVLHSACCFAYQYNQTSQVVVKCPQVFKMGSPQF